MERVKNIRKACRITQATMAEALGLGQSNYCNIENGRLIPKNIDEIQQSAIEFLTPNLKSIIAVCEAHVSYLKDLLQSTKND